MKDILRTFLLEPFLLVTGVGGFIIIAYTGILILLKAMQILTHWVFP